MPIKNKKKENVCNIYSTLIIEIFYFVYFLRMTIGADSIYGYILYGVMSSIGLASIFYFLFVKNKIKYKVLIPLIAFFVFGVISSLYTGNYRIIDFVIILQYFGVGLLLINYSLNYKITSMSFIFYTCYFAINLIIGKHPDELFIGFSRNNIIIFMLLQCVLFYVSMYQNKIKIKIYPAIILVIFSFWAIGRSGILVSLLLLFLIIIYTQINNSAKLFNLLYIPILFFLLFFITTTFFYDELLGTAIERTMRLGVIDIYRKSIIFEYYYNLNQSAGALFWGVPIKDNYVFSEFGYNLHNSYLRLHAYHGLFGVLLILIMIIRTLFKYFKFKEYLYLGLLLILMVRMSVDIPAFHGPYDPLIYFFTLNRLTFKK